MAGQYLFLWRTNMHYIGDSFPLDAVVVETSVALLETKAGNLREDIFVARTLRRFERKTKIYENCRINYGKHNIMTNGLSN